MTVEYPSEPFMYSTIKVKEAEPIAQNVQERLTTVEGVGYCNLVHFHTTIGAESDHSNIIIIVDDVEVLKTSPIQLNTFGCDNTTPRLTLTRYNIDGANTLYISKRWEFRRMFAIDALNTEGTAQVDAYCFVGLMW